MKSDNLLLAVAALAAVIAIFGAGFTYYSSSHGGLTGFVTQSTATTNVTVTQNALINFTTNNINWGSGSVAAGNSNATLDTATNTTTGGQGFNKVGHGFVLKNIGNVNVTLQLKTNKNAQTFLGGTNPSYQYNVTNLDTNACDPASGFNLGQWYDVNTSGSYGTLVCQNLSFSSGSNRIRIDIKLVIPSDSNTGSLGDTMTATGTPN